MDHNEIQSKSFHKIMMLSVENGFSEDDVVAYVVQELGGIIFLKEYFNQNLLIFWSLKQGTSRSHIKKSAPKSANDFDSGIHSE